METPIYSFQSADGLDRDVSPMELQDWVRSGKLKLDDTVTNFFSGQRFKVRDVIQDAPTQYSVPPTMSPGYAAYPRQEAGAADLSGFNLGAFAYGWIWGINHKKYWLLAMLLLGRLPFGWALGFAILVYAGINGNKWAWESGRFGTVAEMRKCQKIWQQWAILQLSLYGCCILLIFWMIWTAHNH